MDDFPFEQQVEVMRSRLGLEEQLMENEASMCELFQEGHYTQLVGQIEQTLTNTPTDGLHRTLLLKNNLIICKLMLMSSIEGKAAVLPELENILLTCSSVPAGEEMLYTELVALCNYLYTSLLCLHQSALRPLGLDGQSSDGIAGSQSIKISRVYHTVNRTLFIVYKQLAVEGLDVQGLASMSPRESCLALIDRCLTSLLYRLTGFGRISLMLCWCVVLVTMLQQRDVQQDGQNMGKCLEKVHLVLSGLDKNTAVQQIQSGDGLMVSLQADHRDIAMTSQTVGGVVRYLQAVDLYRASRWADCHAGLQKIEADELKVVANFFSGWCLYHGGQYLEAVALLMETLRSQRPISQRLKARIYSCIATCFTKMEKVQLAIHMYREALSADFGYLLPLYHVSELYRQQGNSDSPDMELECLNLLVTALEMRQQDSVCTASGLELLDLVDVEDQDIPYPRALYLMASRALAHHRYEVASEKFTQLITYLKSWQADAQALKAVPSLDQIYQETVQALLKTNRFAECVSMCDTVLSANSCHSDHSNTRLEDSCVSTSNLNGTILSNSYHDDSLSQLLSVEALQGSSCGKKRKLSNGDGDKDGAGSKRSQAEVTTLKLKAEALVKLGDKTSALTCLERASDSISQHRRALLKRHMKTEDRPACKRRKLDPTSSASDGEQEVGSIGMERDIYRMTMDILTSQNQHKQAEHYKRLASQLDAMSSRLGVNTFSP